MEGKPAKCIRSKNIRFKGERGNHETWTWRCRVGASSHSAFLACLFVGLVVVAPALSPSPLPFCCGHASQASKQAGKRREAGRQEEGREDGLRSPLSLPLPPLACLLACCVLRLSFAFALAAVRRSCFVLAEDAWLARPPFLPLHSLPLPLSSQATNIRPPHWTPLCLSSLSALYF